MVEPETNRISPPAGWNPVGDIGGPFILHNGPIFHYGQTLPPEEPVRYGFRVEERHCNMRMVCHGGMLASFLDLCLARGATSSLAIRIGAPTMNLSVDYLNPARLGDWVESRVTVLRRTRQTAFVQALLLSGAHLLARGSAIYRLPKQEEA